MSELGMDTAMNMRVEAGERAKDDRGNLRELRALLGEFDTAMLVTTTRDGMMRARPMAMQDQDAVADCDLWFVTGDDTAKTIEIAEHHQVAVVCYRPRDRAYVSISAVAREEKNRSEIVRLWKPDWKLWFPRGEEDPTITLLKLRVERAEYWEPQGGRLRIIYEMVKAAITGEPADLDLNPPKRL